MGCHHSCSARGARWRVDIADEAVDVFCGYSSWPQELWRGCGDVDDGALYANSTGPSIENEVVFRSEKVGDVINDMLRCCRADSTESIR